MKPVEKNIAIALLNWNGKKWLEKFLPDLLAHSRDAKIYVIDNASEDDSVVFLQKNYPQIKIISLPVNVGFAEGYNKGLIKIPEDFIVLLNTDVQVSEGWLDPLVDLLLSDEKIAAVQSKIRSYRNPEYFEYAGAAGGFLDNLGYPYCDGRIGNKVEKDTGQYDKIKEIQWASGACMLVRKSVFFKTGGFDEKFFAHQEEIDWAWRARRHGYKIMYQPGSVVYHVGGGSLSYGDARKIYLNFRNNLLTLIKNLPPQMLFPVFFSRLILDGLAGVMFLFQGKPSHTFAVIKAHFSVYTHLLSYLKTRRKPYIKRFYKEKWTLLNSFF